MITLDKLRKLKIGEKIEAEGVFPGVSKEPLVWERSGGNEQADELLFAVSYMGVNLGEFCVYWDLDENVRVEAV